MSFDPRVAELQKRLLGEMYGRAGIFNNTDLRNSGTNLDTSSQLGKVGNQTYSIGIQKARGKEQVHQDHPNEIEYYACALELINSKGITAEFFSFPLMPTQIQSSETTNTSIQKTVTGVMVMNNPTFVPYDISISGSFGRRFRKLNHTIHKTELPAKMDNEFSSDYKTGYGCTQILRKMLDKSQGIDASDRSYTLLLYNLSLNQVVVVELMNKTFSQSKEMNAIWQYSMHFKVVAPASAVRNQKELNTSLTNMLSFNRMNNEFGDQCVGIKSLLDPNSMSGTRVRKIMEKQVANKVLNAMGDRQTNALTVIQQLVSNPNNADDFIINAGEGLTNSLPR